jgi:mono/diheme cytochrome c family protein
MKTTIKSILSASFIVAMTAVLLSFYVVQQQPAGKAWDIPAKYKAMKNPSVGKNVEIGKSLWAKHCKSCHGNVGLGDGPKSKMLKTAAGDFSSAKFQAQSDGVMYYQVVVGRDEMPAFDKKLTTEEDRWAVINYMRTMKK